MDTIYTDGTYLRNNPHWHADDSAWKAAHIARLLERNGVLPRTVCEIGCGAGAILVSLKEALPEGTRFTGYDISPNAFAICSHKVGPCLDFRLGNLLDEDAHFDLAMAIDVFEHVDDYLQFIKRVKSLAPYKVFHIPLDLSVQSVFRGWPIMGLRDDVGHIHYFFKQTALSTIEDCGGRVIDHHYTASRLELPNQGFTSQVMKLPRRLMFGLSQDFAVRLLGGYSLLVLAK